MHCSVEERVWRWLYFYSALVYLTPCLFYPEEVWTRATAPPSVLRAIQLCIFIVCFVPNGVEYANKKGPNAYWGISCIHPSHAATGGQGFEARVARRFVLDCRMIHVNDLHQRFGSRVPVPSRTGIPKLLWITGRLLFFFAQAGMALTLFFSFYRVMAQSAPFHLQR